MIMYTKNLKSYLKLKNRDNKINMYMGLKCPFLVVLKL